MHTVVERSSVAVTFDPPESVPRLAMIALSSDLTSERDAARLIPRGAALHVARVMNVNPATPDNLARMAPQLTDAAALLPEGVTLGAILYGCTAASVAIGDETVVAHIRKARPGVPVVTPVTAAVDAFAALGVSRIAVMAPYVEETAASVVRWFGRHGLDIVSAQCLGVADDRDIARLGGDTIIDAALAVDTPDAEALFLSCTALPALGIIDELEARLDKPVVTSNQAGFWRLLRHGGLSPRPDAPGRLFAHELRERVA